ncbi:HAD hydrolase-like protein (plasmid) [Streptomyces sp. NBC_01340]|uniref:HAD family hydrolase n=1 Tax=unclassified Streptomyces TaxID=2593676 RepID=UPI00224F9046|nr:MULTISPECIES: HAD family hydrolase [unclassified Streptomyces]MCX4461161.1 HAD hydrolase-like protein [Streptomyces sp. NBC_01719]MCX4499510.1 HAD hydrolase-like protein [Streptomyces sp. NBC_01728]WSI44651.1 HAD hydrolase-like protein [Streptomyces sp. NBC_01340]
MNALRVRLVSLDVGYTLGAPSGVTLTQRLAALSALSEDQAKQLVQEHLHPVRPDDTAAIQALCRAIGVDPAAFPYEHRPQPFTLWPGAREAVARIARLVPVVTLSNVTYWDEGGCDVQALLAPHLAGHYPSWRLGFAKPDPQAVSKVAAVHGVPAAEVLHVGDSLAYDVQGALAAGAQAVWITHAAATGATRQLLAEHTGRLTIVPDLDTAAAYIEQTLTGHGPSPTTTCRRST